MLLLANITLNFMYLKKSKHLKSKDMLNIYLTTKLSVLLMVSQALPKGRAEKRGL